VGAGMMKQTGDGNVAGGGNKGEDVVMDARSTYQLKRNDLACEEDDSEEEIGPATQAMRDRVTKEYAWKEFEEVPDSQPETMSDFILDNVKTDLLESQKEGILSGKEAVIDEHRRRRSRTVSDKHVMDKAKDRAMLKKLEVTGESIVPTVLNSSFCILQDIADKVGLKLGRSAMDVRKKCRGY
jgi:hypothetical protein